MTKQRKKYTEDFKTMIAELAKTDKPIKEISSQYSLNESMVRRWVRERTEIKMDGESITIEELKKIQKENAKLREEVEILKKAMAIFATK